MSEDRKTQFGWMAVWAVVALIFLVIGVALVRSFDEPAEGSAPDFTLPAYDGGEIALSDYEGQVVVLNFWASWCGPCKEEAADLEQAWQAYQDEGVQFIGIGYLDSEDKALAYLEEFDITYPNGPDLRNRISDRYEIRGVPETFIINPEGEIVYYVQRPVSYDELVAQIERAMP